MLATEFRGVFKDLGAGALAHPNKVKKTVADGTCVLGAAALGILLGALESRTPHPLLRPFLAIGVLGAFTTFSTLALEAISLSLDRGLLFGGLKLSAALGLGLFAFLVGERGGRRL